MKPITFFILLFLLYGCGAKKGPIEKKISKIIEENKDSGSCMIALKRITDFNWDTVYFIGNSDEISNIIKRDYPYHSYYEFTAAVIFLYKGKIVYHEYEETGFEDLLKGEIVIGDDLVDTCRYEMFVPENAIFRGCIQKDGGKEYYQLIPIGKKEKEVPKE